MSDGTVSGTFGAVFEKLGTALNQWSTWGALLLIGLGLLGFNLLREIVAHTTKSDARGAKTTLISLALVFGVAATIAWIGDQMGRPHY